MRYVQHLLASTSGREEQTSPGQQISLPSSSRETESIELRFTSQCEHHLLPFQGTIQVHSPRKQNQELLSLIQEDAGEAS